MSPGINLNELARRFKVSRATVARILNRNIIYTRPTYRRRADKIRRAALRMGYRPNAAAKAVSTGRFGHVGLLMGTHYERSNFSRELLRGIHDGLSPHRIHYSVWFLDDSELSDQTSLPRFLSEQLMDGLLINYTHELPHHFRAAVKRVAMPAVWLNVKEQGDCVYPDDLQAGRKAVQYLCDLGHRQLAFADFVHGPENPFRAHYSVFDRRQGVEEGMAEMEVKHRFLTVRRALPGPEAIQAAAAFLREPPIPTAVICHAARDAAICHAAAVQLGISVPRDLSLLTFGPDRLNESIFDLTHFIEPNQAMGRMAAERLIACINGEADPEFSRPVPYQLKTGNSTTTPP